MWRNSQTAHFGTRRSSLRPAGKVRQNGATNQKQKYNRMNLERKIESRVHQTAGQRKPEQDNEPPATVNATAQKPMQRDGDKRECDQGASEPAKGDARFQP